MQTIEKSTKSWNLFEFIAGIEYLHELLFLVWDMASINNERMKQNAKILEWKIFSLDIFKLIQFGLDSFDPNLHPEYHMHALLRFSDIAILSIEKYSKGQSLTINTHKKKRAPKKKKEFGGFEEEDGMIGDVMELVSDEESDREEVIVTKQFHFKVEIAKMIDYHIIKNITTILWNPEDLEETTADAIAHLF